MMRKVALCDKETAKETHLAVNGRRGQNVKEVRGEVEMETSKDT